MSDYHESINIKLAELHEYSESINSKNSTEGQDLSCNGEIKPLSAPS